MRKVLKTILIIVLIFLILLISAFTIGPEVATVLVFTSVFVALIAIAGIVNPKPTDLKDIDWEKEIESFDDK